MSLNNNLLEITDKIEQARAACPHKTGRVELIAVSKTETTETIRELYALGHKEFAENRPQMLRDRLNELSDLQINWHFIGHLQSNKIKYVYPYAHLVHSIDSVELIEDFIKTSDKTGHICPILLQVHISGEASKQGFAPDEILTIIKQYNNHPKLSIRGLMGMAPLDATEATTRTCFKQLYQLFCESKAYEGIAYKADILSMGMSGDYELAIAEGANMVRIGSAIFKR